MVRWSVNQDGRAHSVSLLYVLLNVTVLRDSAGLQESVDVNQATLVPAVEIVIVCLDVFMGPVNKLMNASARKDTGAYSVPSQCVGWAAVLPMDTAPNQVSVDVGLDGQESTVLSVYQGRDAGRDTVTSPMNVFARKVSQENFVTDLCAVKDVTQTMASATNRVNVCVRLDFRDLIAMNVFPTPAVLMVSALGLGHVTVSKGGQG